MNKFRGYIIIGLYISLTLTAIMLAYAGLALWPTLDDNFSNAAVILLALGAWASAFSSWHASRKVAHAVKTDSELIKLDYLPFLAVAFSILVASYLFT